MNDLMICSVCKVPVPPEGHDCPGGGYPIAAPPPPPWIADPELLATTGYRCSSCGINFETREDMKAHVKGGHK